ncbi:MULTISPECIES: DUF6281 family protein [unclassified Streptomyces]|uniref:DUF6281 family protein n=1 Tax=unclassified Streptomyces TaxID=2593676 RepID=UPI00380A607B
MSRSDRTTRVPLVAAMLMLAAACTSQSDGGGGGGDRAESCAYLVVYEGRTYQGVANVEFTAGEKLGSAAVPPCQDTGEQDTTEAPAETTTAYTVDGISPALAVAVGDTPDEITFMAVHRGGELPPEVRKLINRP